MEPSQKAIDIDFNLPKNYGSRLDKTYTSVLFDKQLISVSIPPISVRVKIFLPNTIHTLF
jgi:hypothetical protein